ncbi:MAG TPA: DUF5668 domain-containing protein [Desulfitobacteriaceae bacterium]|jgi:hypothetical protein|nr:DUF5668 domain-containing protein [Desulfitobacteriaceae bacterium]
MLKERKVGTVTTGIILIVFGFMFIAHYTFHFLNYSIILCLWPLILIFLGIEIIVSYLVKKEEDMRYDGWAIALTIILSFFAMAMAGAEFIINHFSEFKNLL